MSVCLLVTSTSYAKTVESIEMPFGIWILVGPSNCVLDGGPAHPQERTIRAAQNSACTNAAARPIQSIDWRPPDVVTVDRNDSFA